MPYVSAVESTQASEVLDLDRADFHTSAYERNNLRKIEAAGIDGDSVPVAVYNSGRGAIARAIRSGKIAAF